MAEPHDTQRQPTFIHIDSQLIEPQVRMARTSRASRQSEASTRTWIYTSQQSTREPPSIIIPIGPADPPRHVVEFGGLDGEEYMNIDPDGPDLESAMTMGSPTSSRRKLGRRWVGGFVSRLRKLPKTVMKGRRQKRKPKRLGTRDTGTTEGTTGTGRTNTTGQMNFPQPTGPSNVQYVEASEMFIAEPSGMPSRCSSRSTERYRPDGSTQHSRIHSHDIPSAHESHHNETTPHQRECLVVPSEAVSGAFGNPAQFEPVPVRSPDYAKMNAPRVTSEPSLKSQIFRFDRFIRDLKHLPWVSTRITVDYIPGESTQCKAGKSIKSSASWYTHPRRPLDLLSTGTSTSDSARSPYSHRGHARYSSPSLASPHTSPTDNRATRHRSPRTRSHDAVRAHGRGYPLYPYAYPHYGYSYSPQPLFVMQSPNRPNVPQANPQQPFFPEISQAVPVYMVPPSTGSPVTNQVHQRTANRSGNHHPEIHPYPLSVPGHPAPPTS